MSVTYLHSGETQTDFTVKYGDTLFIDGGTADKAVSYGTISVSNGGKAYDVTLDGLYNESLEKCVGGNMEVLEGGTASGITVLGLTKANDGHISLSYRLFEGVLTVSGGTAIDVSVSTYGKLNVVTGTVCGVTLKGNSHCTVGNGGVLSGKITLQGGCDLKMDEGSVLEFTVDGCVRNDTEALVSNASLIPDTASIVVALSANQQFGRYHLADKADDFNRNMTVKADGCLLTELSPETATISDVTQRSYSLTIENSTLWLEILPSNGEFSCVANPDGVSYTITMADTVGPQLAISHNGNALLVDATENTILWNLAGGDVTLSVEGGTAEETIMNDVSRNIFATASGKAQTEIFLANVTDQWQKNYYASHVGCVNGWNGTDEKVELRGRNVIASIFDGGSADTNAILCLTDDANGDALFLEDLYSTLPEEATDNQARIARIDEIRAGAGNDVIDMTSKLFDYVGEGVTIRGGAGDDVLWSGNGENRLFGDAGNDRLVGGSGKDLLVGGIGDDSMHGGGGDDLFCFCENWGNDIVQQVSGGQVTLVFASGNKNLWNAETMKYTDGANSVSVIGVDVDAVTLKFLNEDPTQYADLVAAGAFDGFSSERLFADGAKGMLA